MAKTEDDILTIKQLIDLLEECDHNDAIYFDFCCFVPDSLESYRGYYEQLAIGYTREKQATVGEFLAKLKNIIGRKLTGYKGGRFLMEENTKVWVDDFGECSDTAVVGVTRGEFCTLIETAYIKWD